jgi:hypothetical protein
MAEQEQPERLQPGREPSVDDVRQLLASATPHFAMQLRARLRRLIESLPPDHPARLEAERGIARLESLAFEGEVRGEGYQDGMRPLPSLGDESPRYVEGATHG